MISTPIELVFYDGDDNPIKTYSRTRVPSYLLDMAMEMRSLLNDEEKTKEGTAEESDNGKKTKEELDAVFDFVVEFYSKDRVPQFTRDELKLRSDLGECMTVLSSVITRASSFAKELAKQNPTVPSLKKR